MGNPSVATIFKYNSRILSSVLPKYTIHSIPARCNLFCQWSAIVHGGLKTLGEGKGFEFCGRHVALYAIGFGYPEIVAGVHRRS